MFQLKTNIYQNMEFLSVSVCYSIKQWCGFLFRGGKCLSKDGGLGCEMAHYPEANSSQKIWIDDLLCSGFEDSIDECQMSNWGTHNCLHKEDAGCICKDFVIVQFRKNNYIS